MILVFVGVDMYADVPDDPEPEPKDSCDFLTFVYGVVNAVLFFLMSYIYIFKLAVSKRRQRTTTAMTINAKAAPLLRTTPSCLVSTTREWILRIKRLRALKTRGGPVKLDSMWQHRLTRLVRDRYMYSIRITV